MNPATPNGETPVSPAPSNEPSNPSVPAPVNSGVDVEQAKRETEQARIRANQLENELKKMRDEQEAARLKQLEEKEEFKTLYEQTQARLREIEEASTRAEQQATVATATAEILKDYPDNVVELAKTAGLTLTDDSEAAKASLKAKLDSFKATVGTNPVTPNNPSNPTPNPNRDELAKRDNLWEGSPMARAAAAGDLQPQYEFIRGLPSIARMKEIARNGN